MTDADFDGHSARFANFTGANLAGANLRGCDLRGAEIEWVLTFKGADMFGVTGMNEEQVRSCRDKGAMFGDEDRDRTGSRRSM